MAAQKVIGVILIIFAVILIVLGPVLYTVILDTIDESIKKSYRYEEAEFVSAENAECETKSDIFYFYHMLNEDGFLAGDLPLFEQRGPYQFDHDECRFEEVLDKDNAQVTYKYYTTQPVFNDSQSNGLPTDEITNINPGYNGLLEQVNDREELYRAGVTAAALLQVIQGMQSPEFIDGVKVGAVASTISSVYDGFFEVMSQVVSATAAAQTIDAVLQGVALQVSNPLFNAAPTSGNTLFPQFPTPETQAPRESDIWGGLINPPTTADVSASNVANQIAREIFFNDDTFAFAPVIQGFSNYFGGSIGISTDAQTALLFGNAPYQAPGWLTPLGDGTPGILAFLGYFQQLNATGEDGLTTFMTAYSLQPDQLEPVLGYVTLHLMADVPPIAVAPSTVEFEASKLTFSQWANGTVSSDPTPFPVGNQVFTGWELGLLPQASNLTLKQCQALFDDDYAYSLTGQAGILTWFAALQNTDLQTSIAISLSLTPTQMGQIMQYIFVMFSTQSEEILKESFQVPDLTDLAYVQWGTNSVLGFSLSNVIPLPGTPEYSIVSSTVNNRNMTFGFDDSKRILMGDMALTNADNMITFTALALAQDYQTIAFLWGIPDFDQAVDLVDYVSFMDNTFSNPVIQGWFQDDSGMTVTRSVQEWLYTGADTTLANISPGNEFIGLQAKDWFGAGNGTNFRQITKDVWLGGTYSELFEHLQAKTDPDYGTDYVEWNNENVTVTGYASDERFLPIKSKKKRNEVMYLYNSDLKRPVPFTFTEKRKLKGIKLLRYDIPDNEVGGRASQNEFAGNSLYFQQYNNVFNVTKHYPGRMHFSERYAYRADAEFADTVDPTSYPTLSEEDYEDEVITHLQIEPITGFTMRGILRAQLTQEVHPTTVFFPSLPPKTFAPVFWVDISGEVDDKTAKAFKEGVYDNQDAALGILIAFLVVGVPCLVIGVVLLIV